MNCPHCDKELTAEFWAQLLRSVKSETRTEASKVNGSKGGRPTIQDSLALRSIKSESRAKASKENGKLGGRPKKVTQ